MQSQDKDLPESVESGENPTRTAEPTCSDARPHSSARERAMRGRTAEHGGEVEPLGTPPTNRVPNNCNTEFFKPLRWGVDSLYLSYPGELFPEIDEQFRELKRIAQSPESHEQVKAQFKFRDHLFEVKDKGTRYFPYILEDNAFRIQLSRSKAMPLAYVKVSSEYLTHVGPVEAEKALLAVIERLGDVQGSALVSRIDLFVDFVSSVDMESWDRHAWVTRASGVNAYAVDGQFSGWAIGMGGIMAARLYNKILEIVKSGKAYLLPLWKQGGWKEGETIWRLEFEIKREVLTQKGLSTLPEVLGNLNGLWSYATTEWLKLTEPNPADKTRSRWPIHPLWGYLSSIDWETKGGPLSSRFSPARAPGDERLFSVGFSNLVSYMAREGITDLYQGQEAYITALYAFHENKAYHLGLPFDQYVEEKVRIKARQFNTMDNASNAGEDDLANEADAYRKASDGE